MKKLIKFALFVGAITAVAKMLESKRAEWEGLTETQLRDRIDSKMPERVPDEKRAAVADKVVASMRSAGKLADEDTSSNGDGS